MVAVAVAVAAGLAGAVLGLVALVLGALRAGLRAGDRPGDAEVTAALAGAGQPDETRPVVIVSVRNPSAVPLMAGFSAGPRLVPAWLDGGTGVRVPRRTTRARFRAEAHDVVGVVAPGRDAEFVVPVAVRARRYTLTAVAGQSGGRLRVFRIAVAGPVHDRGQLRADAATNWPRS